MRTTCSDDHTKAGSSSWRERLLPASRIPSPTTQAPHTESNAAWDDITTRVRALAYFVRLILAAIRAAPSFVANNISRQQRHTKSALLPQHTEPLASGSDPPPSPSSPDHLLAAALSSFIPPPAPTSHISPSTERTPLLHPEDLASLIDVTITQPYPAVPRHIEIEAASLSDCDTIKASSANLNIVPAFTIDTPSASSAATTEDSPSSCSTPSSSNSSFVMLRPALKKPSVPNSPRLGLASLDGDDLSTGRLTPKSVRFNTEGNETRVFEYASWEGHTKRTGSLSALGRWKKNGGTIVWQDGPDRPHRSSSPSSLRSLSDIEAEEDAYSRAIFGQSFVGRMMSSLLVGSRSVPLSSVSSSSTITEGRRYGTSLGWGDEMRWRDGMY